MDSGDVVGVEDLELVSENVQELCLIMSRELVSKCPEFKSELGLNSCLNMSRTCLNMSRYHV